MKWLKQFVFINLFKTIIINLKLFPFKQAVRLPIFMYGKVDIKHTCGRGYIHVPVFPGMIKVGQNNSSLFGHGFPLKTRFCIKGQLDVYGGNIRFSNGTVLSVKAKGCLKLNENILINVESTIMCTHSIVIGSNVQISWQCQISDTNFHYILDEERMVSRRNKSVHIGENVWVGNRVTINPGSVVPNDSVVACNTLLNKDYSSEGTKILLGGVPARKIKSGITRLYNKKEEMLADRLFEQYPELEFVQLPSVD